jgi:outer membrane lipoprotein-sorting protein
MAFKSNSVDEILNKIKSTYGTQEKVTAIKDQIQVWVFRDNDGNSGKCVFKYKRPNKLKMEILTMDGMPIMKSIYNGKDGMQFIFGETRTMIPDELKEYETKTLTWINGFHNYEKNGFELKLLSDEVIDDTKYHVIQSTDKYQNIEKSYCNAETGIIEKIQSQQIDPIAMEKVPNVVKFSDHKRFDGVMFATKMITYDAANKPTSFNLEKLVNNTGLSDDEFKVK